MIGNTHRKEKAASESGGLLNDHSTNFITLESFLQQDKFRSIGYWLERIVEESPKKCSVNLGRTQYD
jgi:hypothetical protein